MVQSVLSEIILLVLAPVFIVVVILFLLALALEKALIPIIRFLFAGLFGAIINRLRGQDVFRRWFRMLGYGLSAFFVCPLNDFHSAVVAVCIVSGMLPGWPKWEDFTAMLWRGWVFVPTGVYIGFATGWESGWWFAFVGLALAPSYWIARKLPDFNIGRHLSHWVEKAELLFGFVLFGALALV